MPRRRIIVALLALVLALPSAAFAQGAGDDQYQDPFGDEQAQNDGGNDGGGANGRAAQDDGGLEDEPPVGGGDDGGETDPAPPADEDPADDPEEQPAEEEKALPNTGSDPRILAFVGALFLLVGVGLRLRSIDPDAY
jgi:LPXTG-motif cell wall-anchored protein